MKKKFKLTETNKTIERQVDKIKHEVKKYIARERRKELPEDADYWDFDCKIGSDEKSTKVIHLAEVSAMISKVVTEGNSEFYLEILAKPARRIKK